MAEKIDRNLYVFSFPEKSSEVDRLAPPQPDNLTYRVNVSGDSNCLVSIEADGQSAGPGSSVSLEVTPDTTVTISCSVPDGWEFVCWTGLPQGVGNTNPTSFTVTGDVRASVYTQEPKYTVTLNSNLTDSDYSVEFYKGYSSDVSTMQRLESSGGTTSFRVSKHPGQAYIYCKLIGPNSELKYYLKSYVKDNTPIQGNPISLPEVLEGDITYTAVFEQSNKIAIKTNDPDLVSVSRGEGFVTITELPKDEDDNHYFYSIPVSSEDRLVTFAISVDDDNFLFWDVSAGNRRYQYTTKTLVLALINSDYIIEPIYVVNDATVTFVAGEYLKIPIMLYMKRVYESQEGDIHSKWVSYRIGDNVSISTQDNITYAIYAETYVDPTMIDSESIRWIIGSGILSTDWSIYNHWNTTPGTTYRLEFDAKQIATFKEVVDKINELVEAWNKLPCHDDTDPDLPHTINPI